MAESRAHMYKDDMKRIQEFENKCMGKMLKIRWAQKWCSTVARKRRKELLGHNDIKETDLLRA